MTEALLDRPMTTSDKPKASSVKLHDDVIETARIVSAYRGETMTDMLSGLLRPLLADLEKREVEKRGKAPAKAKPAK